MKLRKTLEAARVKFTASQQRYKAHFDRDARLTEKVEKGDNLHADLQRNTQRYLYLGIGEQECPAGSDPNRTLAPKGSGPYKVLRATAETVLIRHDGSENTTSINQIVKKPTLTPKRSD